MIDIVAVGIVGCLAFVAYNMKRSVQLHGLYSFAWRYPYDDKIMAPETDNPDHNMASRPPPRLGAPSVIDFPWLSAANSNYVDQYNSERYDKGLGSDGTIFVGEDYSDNSIKVNEY
jgi:hypothetical protein